MCVVDIIPYTDFPTETPFVYPMTTPEEAAPIPRPETDASAPVSGNLNERVHGLLEKVDLPFHLPTSIYGGMLAIWHFRRVAQRRFPLHKGHTRDYIRYLAWCTTWGRQKYALLREIPAWDQELNRPIDLPHLRKDRWAGTFSVGQFLFGVAHYHYTISALMRDRRARDKVARAYWRGERIDSHLPAAPPWQVRRLRQVFGSSAGLVEQIATPRELRRKLTNELTTCFGIPNLDSLPSKPSEDAVYPVAPPPLPERSAYLPFPRKAVEAFSMANLGAAFLKDLPGDRQLKAITERISLGPRSGKKQHFPFGVNLFGHANGELGIGEDVRLVAQAFHQNQIPFCIINVAPGQGVSQCDTSVDNWITKNPKYGINIFCMTGFEHSRYICEYGRKHTAGRYNIGFWPWELPTWPESCSFAYSVVDEIWGISKYTANAYRRAPCPVYSMSLPVTVDGVANMDRASFGLPKDKFLFVFSFDANSTYARKNPFAVIAAFKKAFSPTTDLQVGLVIKVSHRQSDRSNWRRLMRMVAPDSRIHIVAETLRRPQVLALIRSCDCFVSLHSAEGFGRGIAEAMLMGRQVITTGYSGNLDYCVSGRAELVDYTLRKLLPGEYFFGDGQSWAEPDVNHAAKLMRKVSSRSWTPCEPPRELTPLEQGRLYARRLDEIRLELSKLERADV